MDNKRIKEYEQRFMLLDKSQLVFTLSHVMELIDRVLGIQIVNVEAVSTEIKDIFNGDRAIAEKATKNRPNIININQN